MAKTKSERNREDRLRRIEEHGIEWERERKVRTGCYVPVNQLSPKDLKLRRKAVRKRKQKSRGNKHENPAPPTQVHWSICDPLGGSREKCSSQHVQWSKKVNSPGDIIVRQFFLPKLY